MSEICCLGLATSSTLCSFCKYLLLYYVIIIIMTNFIIIFIFALTAYTTT